ncbi:solute carrier family 2, facilitated glucose transporter member 1 isoform X1 [Lingula anatina]|uniref:Solute carrier family 2, facilitated glucose transporter member 1 isoform X1 n=1 Tax=Lingula anatina TaxID=7574 RepID=A0A1S3I922_LINAN|nr:solute carrier family 2, facilitated glucose transporter member 1 isoform X1 [Lingula anatina]|eukprot:XP_013394366.1 solute carrier family 2, facilitated glucose transporter member 1 isoform X1 [Lingula anatina]
MMEGSPQPGSRSLTWRLTLSVLSAILGSFTFGYNTGVINAPQAIIEDFMNYTQLERSGNIMEEGTKSIIWGFAVAIFAVGGMTGGVLAGWWSHVFGRKIGMLLCNVFTIIGAALMGTSQVAKSYEMIIVGRLVVGLSCGLFTGLVPMYINEVAPTNLRGALGTLHQLGVTVGILVSQILGIPEILGNVTGWPILLGLTGAPAVLQLLTLPLCPASPRHLLIDKSKEKEARDALVALRGSQEVEEEMEEMRQEKKAGEKEAKMNLIQLFRTATLRQPLLVSVVMHLSQQLSGILVVFYYSTSLFTEAGIDDQKLASYLTVGVGGIMVIMTFVTIPLMDRAGRRTLHLIGLLGMLVLGILLTISMALQNLVQWFSYISVASALLFVVFFALGPGSIPWMIVAELFSQGPRAAAVSFGVLTNWTANFAVGLAFPPMQKALGVYSFLPFSGLLLLCTIFLWKFLPETKNKTFDEIASLFTGKYAAAVEVGESATRGITSKTDQNGTYGSSTESNSANESTNLLVKDNHMVTQM